VRQHLASEELAVCDEPTQAEVEDHDGHERGDHGHGQATPEQGARIGHAAPG
jgi:hypothetical protein